jgi:hypothetical protein
MLCLFLDLKGGGLHREEGALHGVGGFCNLQWPNLPYSTCSPIRSGAVGPLSSHPPSLKHHATFPGRRAVSHPSVWCLWHGPLQKFLKVAGISMVRFSLSHDSGKLPLFLFSLGPICHFQKEVSEVGVGQLCSFAILP